jgi:hypothetical protein
LTQNTLIFLENVFVRFRARILCNGETCTSSRERTKMLLPEVLLVIAAAVVAHPGVSHSELVEPQHKDNIQLRIQSEISAK